MSLDTFKLHKLEAKEFDKLSTIMPKNGIRWFRKQLTEYVLASSKMLR